MRLAHDSCAPAPRRLPAAMKLRFRVHDLRRARAPVGFDDLGLYLSRLVLRFHNGMDAQTRVYSCRSWWDGPGATAPYDLHWNDDTVPGGLVLRLAAAAQEWSLNDCSCQGRTLTFVKTTVRCRVGTRRSCHRRTSIPACLLARCRLDSLR